jgi:integrase
MSTRFRPVVSCDQCLAWGVPDRAGRCRLCHEFGRRHPDRGPCLACSRSVPLQKGFCRLCWCQARLDRGVVTYHSVLLPFVQQVQHHQLSFARMPGPRDTVVKPPRDWGVGSGAPGIRRTVPPPVTGQPTLEPVQLRLFDDLRREYRYGRVDLRREPVPDNPWLAWALHLAHTMAETRGWSDIVYRTLNRNLVMLLAGHLDGVRIRYSDYQPVVRDRMCSLRHVTEVLQTMGILLDDRPDIFEAWLAGKFAALCPGIRRDVERWARTLREGGPRVRRRDEGTIRNHIYNVQAALTDWSHRYGHLREVSRDDILAALAARHGFARARMLTALRSLFTWAKRQDLIFHNPTAGIKSGPRERPILQPLTGDDLSHAVNAATAPHARLFIALAAIYAARHGDIRAIRLDDVELGNRRITINGRTRHLDDLTHQVLTDWLDYRRQRWPNTANPYLLVSRSSALGVQPISYPWVGRLLTGPSATIERLRIDRQLDEALASGADPLHVAVVFDLDTSTAIRYANSARQLLQRPHETEPPTSPGTRESTLDNRPDDPLGSS